MILNHFLGSYYCQKNERLFFEIRDQSPDFTGIVRLVNKKILIPNDTKKTI